ncbi:MAG: hypothetical protein ACFCGT_26410 [Sandaracinaceae bacterium]
MRLVGTALTGALAVLYPVAVWWGLTHLGPRAVALLLLAVLVPGLAVRFRRARREDLLAALRVPLVLLALLTLAAVLDHPLFVLALPVAISAALLVTFAVTLRPGGVPLVERFARMMESSPLSDRQVAHCRQFTQVWCAFFVVNGLVAGALALWGSVFAWAAYAGGVAYGLMGLVFVVEYVVRQARFRRYGAGPVDRLLARVFPPREPGEGVA